MQRRHNLQYLPHHVESYIAPGVRQIHTTATRREEIYTAQYWPGESDLEHLEFALALLPAMAAPAAVADPEPAFFPGQIVNQSVALVGDLVQSVTNAGQAVIARAGEWIQYSSPAADGAEYIAVCLPAFSPPTVHRDA